MNSLTSLVAELLERPDESSERDLSIAVSHASDKELAQVWDELPEHIRSSWGQPAWLLPELPESMWTDAMRSWAVDHTVTYIDETFGRATEFELRLNDPPAVATRDGFRLPEEVVVGIYAELCNQNPWISEFELGGDAYRLTEFVEPSSALRMHWWAQRNAEQFPTDRYRGWDPVFETPADLLRQWIENVCRPRVIQVLGLSSDRSAPLVAWYIRRLVENSDDAFGAQITAMPVLREAPMTPADWLEVNYPRPVPPELHHVARAWLESCAERETSWTLERWREHRELEWFEDCVERLVWRVETPSGRVWVRVEGETFLDIDDLEVPADDVRQISVAHGSHMDWAQLSRWAGMFADYEWLQPFGQLVSD